MSKFFSFIILGSVLITIFVGLIGYGIGYNDGFVQGYEESSEMGKVYDAFEKCEECPVCEECEECECPISDCIELDCVYPVACHCEYSCEKCLEIGCLKPKCNCPMIENVTCPELEPCINMTYTDPLCELIANNELKTIQITIGG